ncbi:hypothetical protein EXIGLDRAFT_400769 [Exidia glandulosa HHB12029]|uniref:Uncharacterized protein n=1 Tax=Exidia glandulosa HHB12029 TaxID=1314781 RepID=A0A166B0T7_EXIGL|nr:hypothetical protein EXIGLDRAFT_400769 [Exidia glandulosa HHB12029]
MSPAARDARIAQIRAEEEALIQTDALYDQLRRDEIDTRATLAAVHAKMDALTAELRIVEARQRTLRSSLDDLRLQHRRDIWTNVIPLEILQHIFELCTISSEEIVKDFGEEKAAYDEAAASFAIATTCSQWREIALLTPRLWTSNNAPLDVLLSFSKLDGDPSALWALVDTITRHGVRLRSFELWLPTHVNGEEINFNQFKAPTPLLERLCIIGEPCPSEPANNARDWGFHFPHAPKLEWLELQYARIASPPPSYRFENLHSIMLWGAYPDEHFRRLLEAASSTVRQLAITGDWGKAPGQDCLSLPNLTELVVCDVLPLLHLCISVPRVQSLELKAENVVPEMAPFLDHFADRVKRLYLVGPGASNGCLDVLRALRNVETFVCTDSDGTREWDLFFGEIAESSPAIWPKLRSIRVDKFTGSKLGDGLLELVEARSGSGPRDDTTDNASVPANLVEIDIADSGAPEWVCASVEHWLKAWSSMWTCAPENARGAGQVGKPV